VRVTTHQSDEYRNIPLVDGLRAASAVLETYRQDLASAVTGRLHAYLPLAALGVPVEFTPPFAGDVRFAGLTGLHPGDRRLIEMGDRIRDLLARMFARVVAGATEDEVYALWRDLTQDRVAEARARFGAPIGEPPSTTIDVRAAAAASRRGGRRFGPHETVDAQAVTDVALAFDRSLAYPAAVLLESIVAHASGPLRLWVLGRQLQDADQAWLAAAFPDVPMTFLPCDEIGYGPTAVVRPRDAGTTDSDLDWLLLPELLTDVDRVVYLDIDTLVLDDVCHLAGTDLGDRPAAARDSFTSEAGEWRRAGRHLAEPVATELRREILALAALIVLADGFAATECLRLLGHPSVRMGFALASAVVVVVASIVFGLRLERELGVVKGETARTLAGMLQAPLDD